MNLRRELAVILTAGICAATCCQMGFGQSELPRDPFESLWETVTETIEKVQSTHPLPPTSQEMLVRGIAALNPEASQANYPELVRQISASSPDQLRTIADNAWQTRIDAGLDPDTLTQQFMDGLMTAVPGVTRWIPAAEAEVTRQLQENRYVGIGISLRWNAAEQKAELLEVFYGGPAWNAKLQPGDRFVEIDGETAVGVGLGEVIGRLRGSQGTQLVVKVERNGAVVSADMTRTQVPIASVEGVTRESVERWDVVFDPDNQLGYLRFVRVGGSTAAEVRSLLRQARDQDCQGLVLDFRGSSGGDFHQTLMLADALLGNGVMGRQWVRGKTEELRSTSPSLWQDKPIVVLAGDGVSADIVWLIDALRQRPDVEVIGAPTVVSGFLTENLQLESGGLLENLPRGFLLLHDSKTILPGTTAAGPNVDLDSVRLKKIGQLALIPDIQQRPEADPAASAAERKAASPSEDEAVKAAAKRLLVMLGE